MRVSSLSQKIIKNMTFYITASFSMKVIHIGPENYIITSSSCKWIKVAYRAWFYSANCWKRSALH